MSEISITKDATCLLKSIHKVYKKRRKKKMSRQEAAFFGDPSDIQKEIMPQWSLRDVEDACWELSDAGLLDCVPGDDTIQMVYLRTSGIAYAEGRFVGIVKTLWNFARELLPFIPSGG